MPSDVLNFYTPRLALVALISTLMCGCQSDRNSSAELKVGNSSFIILVTVEEMQLEDGLIILTDGCGDRLHEAISRDLFHGVPFEIHDSSKVVIKGSITSPYSSKRFTGPVLLLGDSLDRDRLKLQTDYP